MISAPDREEAIKLIEEVIAAGCRQALACNELGLQQRHATALVAEAPGRSTHGNAATPANELDEQERLAVLAAAQWRSCRPF